MNLKTKNCKIDYVGFDPTYNAKSTVGAIVESIIDRAPSDSFVRVCLNRLPSGGLAGEVRVVSRSGVFEAAAHEVDAVATARSMAEKVIEQLKEWKRSRFSNLESLTQLKAS